jgi:hypothetical protein
MAASAPFSMACWANAFASKLGPFRAKKKLMGSYFSAIGLNP